MADEQTAEAWIVGQVADTRRIAEVGFTETKGQLALILQRQDHGERRTAELAKLVEEQFARTERRLEEHDKSIQAAAEERAAERGRVQTMADSAKKFSTWVAIGISLVFGVIGVLLKVPAG